MEYWKIKDCKTKGNVSMFVLQNGEICPRCLE